VAAKSLISSSEVRPETPPYQILLDPAPMHERRRLAVARQVQSPQGSCKRMFQKLGLASQL